MSKSLIKYLRSIPGKLEIKENYKKRPYWAQHTYFGEC